MYNIKNNLSLKENYEKGLLPQRNSKQYFYQDENYSSRTKLDFFQLSSENRRILSKTQNFTFQKISLSEFEFDNIAQKKISSWVKELGWDFPISSIKTVFTGHIFNYLYIWSDKNNEICAYSLCYFDKDFSHIAYVFYNPLYAHQDLPIRLTLQVVINSAELNLNYCYLGRFNPETKLGYYKRNFLGFEYFTNNLWIPYKFQPKADPPLAEIMHIHIVGIAGSMTAPLAIALKKQGHLVTGSDQQKIYPPFSEQLKKAKIPINQTLINKDIDLAIIGSSYLAFSQTKEEFEQIKSQKIPYLSATKYISQSLIKKSSILIAGSYGKTTISAALSYLLEKASFHPSYMFGGQSLNRLDSLHFSNSDWSVLEADESINGLDTKAKFLYYPVKYLILTSIHWEHKESYQNEAENFNAFKLLVQKIPKDGLLIYNQSDQSIKALLPFALCQTIPYSSTTLQTSLIGKFNRQNLASVETLGTQLKIPAKIIASTLKSFRGIKRRLQIKGKINNIIFIDDYAQSANRIKAALLALKETYPTSKLKVFYEAHASFLQHRSNLNELSTVFDLASETVIYRLKFSLKQNSEDRLCARDYLSTIPSSLYLPLSADVVKHYQNSLKNGDILIHFSSGGGEGLITFQKIISSFRKKDAKIDY